MAGGFAISGQIDYSTADPRIAIGVAGTRMTLSAFKRLWPSLVSPRLREWVVGARERRNGRPHRGGHQRAALDAGAGRSASA